MYSIGSAPQGVGGGRPTVGAVRVEHPGHPSGRHPPPGPSHCHRNPRPDFKSIPLPVRGRRPIGPKIVCEKY